jgi:hypothetical protein
VPGFRLWIFGSLIVLLLLSLLLVVSGVGLLRMRPWARTTAIVYVFLMIVFEVVSTVVQVQYLTPGMMAYQKEMDNWQRQLAGNRPMPNNPALGMMESPAFRYGSAIAGALFYLAYPLVLLVFMLRPNVAAALAGKPIPQVEAVEDYWDPRPMDDRQDRR